MIKKLKKSGMSLVELVVAVAVVALLVGLSVPAYRAFDNAINAPTGVESMISAALSSARGLAAKHQSYVGIRFQQDKDGNQYMVMVIYDYDPNSSAPNHYVDSFTAVKGINPVKLPESIGIIDLMSGTSSIGSHSDLIDLTKFENTSTFSVVFSASGNLVIRDVRVNRKSDDDSVFNTQTNINNKIGLFVEDNAKEESRKSFVIIEKKKFDEAVDKWTDYVKDLPVLYINPYTGAIIKNE